MRQSGTGHQAASPKSIVGAIALYRRKVRKVRKVKNRALSLISSVALVLLCCLTLRVSLASAHAKVIGTTPANGSTAQFGLTQIVIIFSEEVSPESSSAQIATQAGSSIAGATSAVDRIDRNL